MILTFIAFGILGLGIVLFFVTNWWDKARPFVITALVVGAAAVVACVTLLFMTNLGASAKTVSQEEKRNNLICRLQNKDERDDELMTSIQQFNCDIAWGREARKDVLIDWFVDEWKYQIEPIDLNDYQ